MSVCVGVTENQTVFQNAALYNVLRFYCSGVLASVTADCVICNRFNPKEEMLHIYECQSM
jgi:hypothetical protein